MISGTKSLALSLGLTVALGALSTPLGCGGSGGGLPAASARADAKLPESIARHVRTCAAEHVEHLRSADLSVRYDVTLASDGEVDSVTLVGSTLGDEDLEACMASALWELSIDTLPARRSSNSDPEPAAAESRMFLGQTQALSCLASPPCVLALAFLIGAAYITVQVIVQTASQSSTAKPKPRAVPTATTVPTASAVPTATTVAADDDYEKICWPIYMDCVESANQPARNQGRFGSKKDCLSCLRECMYHSKPRGVWPDYKCPRN